MRILRGLTFALGAVVLFLVLAIGLLLEIMYLIEAPSPDARKNFRLLEARLASGEALTFESLRPGYWLHACVAGEYGDLPDFRGSVGKPASWAIALFDGKGGHFTWHMNEWFLRYRTKEDQAYGWCFDPSQPLRLVPGPGWVPALLDIPGREVP
jgi:hypothetical protein